MIIQLLRNYKQFTYQEQNIADYIIENPDCIIKYSAKQLAELSYSSSSTVVRFCKKLNFRGYPDFQKQYIKEYNQYTEDYSKAENITKELYLHTIEVTNGQMDREVINYIVSNLIRNRRIDFYASDINYPVCQAMCIKLNSLGYNGQTFNSINQDYIKSIRSSRHLSVLVSHSGNNSTIINYAEALKKEGLEVISISGPYTDMLKNICDRNISLYYEPDFVAKKLQYTLSLQYILDTILLGCLNRIGNNNIKIS